MLTFGQKKTMCHKENKAKMLNLEQAEYLRQASLRI
jgi:hypothetical protein